MSELSLHEAIHTLRSMRRLEPEPIREDDLRYMVEAAIHAPSASNRQDWAFVVVTDPERRREVGEIYRQIGYAVVRDGALASGKLDEAASRVYRNAMILVEHMGDAPALVLVAMRGAPPADAARASAYYGSIYPAIQNLMLAARARGLGTTLTTLHKAREGDIKRLLGIPDEYETIALIPVGHPSGRWGRPLRKPATAVTHWNRFGSQPGSPSS